MDKQLEKKVRDEIADDVNKMVRNQLRKTGRPYPMFTQVALANLLAEAKRACQFSSIAFKPWIKEFIKDMKYEECKRMAQAGESGDPEKYIIKRRNTNRKTNIEYRKRQKANAKNSDDVKRRFDALPIQHKRVFLAYVSADFPPFDGYDEEAAELIQSIERGLDND